MPDRADRVRPPLRAFLASVLCILVSLLVLIPAAPARAIINGKPVVQTDTYAHAIVGIVPLDKYGHPGACTGILLTPRAVLTAAHCVSGEMKGVSVVFDLTIGEQNKVDVTRIVINPAFKNEENKFNPGDLAIIFIADHNNPTVIIPFDGDQRFADGEQFVFAGYGRSDTNRWRSTGVLRKAAIAAAGYDTPSEVVLKPLMDAWPCDGDSGGPIFRKDMSGHYALTGIMNAVAAGPRDECLFENSYMAPIHTYTDWIAATLAQGG